MAGVRHRSGVYIDTDWRRTLSETGLTGLKAQDVSLHRSFFFHWFLFSPGEKTTPLTAVISLSTVTVYIMDCTCNYYKALTSIQPKHSNQSTKETHTCSTSNISWTFHSSVFLSFVCLLFNARQVVYTRCLRPSNQNKWFKRLKAAELCGSNLWHLSHFL